MRLVEQVPKLTAVRHRHFHVVTTALIAFVSLPFLVASSPHVDTAPSRNVALVAPVTPAPSLTPVSSSSPVPTIAGKVKGAATAAASGDEWGIAAGSSLTGLSNADLAQRLDGIKALGVTWVRYDIDWSLIQPSGPASYDWSNVDRVTAAATSRGLRVLGILDATPAWAGISSCRGQQFCQPASNASFATFAAAAASRYNTQISAWEIWNEPNNANFWAPAANAQSYAGLLVAASGAIRAVQPRAFIVTGGLSPAATDGVNIAPADFLSRVYASGAKGSFTAVGDHPYTFPDSPLTNSDHAWTQMTTQLRAIMVANGDAAKSIWVTEFGAPTNGPNRYQVTEAAQAIMAAQTVALWKTYPWGGPLFWYTYLDPGTSTSTNENFFGLVRANGSPKPAYAAFQQAIR